MRRLGEFAGQSELQVANLESAALVYEPFKSVYRMKFVVACRRNRYGEGLGNEMITWAKGSIASEVLNARLVGPSWGLNPRQYWRNFRTSRVDIVVEEFLRHLPHFSFTEQDYKTSNHLDFGLAVKEWAIERGLFRLKHFIVTVDGMYGGYRCVWTARHFLMSKLLSSKDAVPNVYRTMSGLDPRKLFVAVHMRLGEDFAAADSEAYIRGEFNVRIPINWYTNVCQALLEEFGDRIEFRFFSDKMGLEFREIVARFNPNQQIGRGLTECSDLILMAEADLRVCSISSYSMMAGMLGFGPYLWYEPQLHLHDGLYSLWGCQTSPRQIKSLSPEGVEVTGPNQSGFGSEFRGYPVVRDGVLPSGLIAQLHRTLAKKDPLRDLLRYGCVPVGSHANSTSAIPILSCGSQRSFVNSRSL